jgi:hypothetical protein
VTQVFRPAATAQITVVERGVCTFTEKVPNVLNAGGYEGVLVFNTTASDACNQTLAMSVAGDFPPSAWRPRHQGYAIFGVESQHDDAACLAGDGGQMTPIPVGAMGTP